MACVLEWNESREVKAKKTVKGFEFYSWWRVIRGGIGSQQHVAMNLEVLPFNQHQICDLLGSYSSHFLIISYK